MFWNMKKRMRIKEIQFNRTHRKPPLKRGLLNDFLTETILSEEFNRLTSVFSCELEIKSFFLRGDLQLYRE